MGFDAFPSNRLPAPIASAVNHILQIDQLEALYARASAEQGFVQRLLEDLNVQLDVTAPDLVKIPREGPVVVVSNHPFGILDGVMLAHLLTRVRPDVRILTNRMLGTLPELAELCFFIDPFDNPQSRGTNGRALKEAIRHLRRGGLLLVFPAGEVSHFDLKKRAVSDPEWSATAARLIRITRAKSLPVLIQGANGLPFQMLGMVHPRLRTAALPAEMLNKRGKSVEIRIGSPIDPSRIESLPDEAEATAYLRLRTELLAHRDPTRHVALQLDGPLAHETPKDQLAREIGSLPVECRLEAARDLEVYIAGAKQIPQALREIGRLREITFREAGEGTGEPVDLDRFDSTYLHLFLWNKQEREIVGAYRIGEVPKLIARFGTRGLYTESLFRFRAGFFGQLGPALELGRSFIRAEYQRHYAPLLLLWKGIVAFVARNQEYSTLIGAVSVSNQYSRASRELIARYFEKQQGSNEWRGAVQARRPLRGSLVRRWEAEAMRSLLPDFEDLSAPISDLEPDGKGIPVLVRQYVKLGGKLLAFSVDPQFGNTLDAFVMVDLTRTSPEILGRYMGKEQAGRFLAFHRERRPRVA